MSFQVENYLLLFKRISREKEFIFMGIIKVIAELNMHLMKKLAVLSLITFWKFQLLKKLLNLENKKWMS